MREYHARDLCEVLKNKFEEINEQFFSYAWREKLGEILKEENKFSRLIEWLDKEIELCGALANIFSPTDWQNDFLPQYLETIQKYAVMIHIRALLIDDRMTTKMRKNIEKIVCNQFGVHYNEELDCYV